MANKRRGNNEGSIYQRKNGSWRAQILLKGQRLSFNGVNRKECQNWLRETLHKADNYYSFEGAKTNLEEFLSNWLVSISSSRTSTTVNLYRWTIENHVIPILGNTKLKDLRPDHIQGLYDYKIKSGQSPHAVHQIHKVLRVALGHAVKLGLLIRNPAKSTSPPKPIQNEMRIFDENQIHLLLNTAIAIKDNYYPIYYLAISTGMRQAEIFGLKWNDLDLKQKTIKVQRQLVRLKGGGYEFRKPKSNSGKRTIILGERTIEVLLEHQENQWHRKLSVGENWINLDLIFPSRIGTPIVGSNLRRSFRKLIKISGLPKIRFHDLRHTAASLMLNYGIPVMIVSRIMGHAKPSITLDVYGHLIPSRQEEAAALMDEILTPISIENCTLTAP